MARIDTVWSTVRVVLARVVWSLQMMGKARHFTVSSSQIAQKFQELYAIKKTN